MERRPLGKTGIEVGEVGLSLAWDGAGERIARRAVELGCTLFLIDGDTAAARRALDTAMVLPRGTEPDGVILRTYNLIEQIASVELFPKARRDGLGIVAEDVLAGGALRGPIGHTPRGALAAKYRFLVRDGRTLAQAAVEFVLANEYVSCAVAGVASVAEAEEVLSAPDAEPLTLTELEGIFETWAGRCEH